MPTMPVAYRMLFLAAFASPTVKNRIRMCGNPAVPKINANPSETAETGSDTRPPGLIIAACFGWARIACEKRAFRLKPKRLSTMIHESGAREQQCCLDDLN